MTVAMWVYRPITVFIRRERVALAVVSGPLSKATHKHGTLNRRRERRHQARSSRAIPVVALLRGRHRLRARNKPEGDRSPWLAKSMQTSPWYTHSSHDLPTFSLLKQLRHQTRP